MISKWRWDCEQNDDPNIRENNDPSASATGDLQPYDGRGAKKEKGRTWI